MRARLDHPQRKKVRTLALTAARQWKVLIGCTVSTTKAWINMMETDSISDVDLGLGSVCVQLTQIK